MLNVCELVKACGCSWLKETDDYCSAVSTDLAAIDLLIKMLVRLGFTPEINRGGFAEGIVVRF